MHTYVHIDAMCVISDEGRVRGRHVGEELLPTAPPVHGVQAGAWWEEGEDTQSLVNIKSKLDIGHFFAEFKPPAGFPSILIRFAVSSLSICISSDQY